MSTVSPIDRRLAVTTGRSGFRESKGPIPKGYWQERSEPGRLERADRWAPWIDTVYANFPTPNRMLDSASAPSRCYGRQIIAVIRGRSIFKMSAVRLIGDSTFVRFSPSNRILCVMSSIRIVSVTSSGVTPCPMSLQTPLRLSQLCVSWGSPAGTASDR